MQALAFALATWGGDAHQAQQQLLLSSSSRATTTPPPPLHARTPEPQLGDDEEEAALVAACRAPLLDPLDDAPARAAALAAASAAYGAALAHPRVGAGWVEGWREWGEVLWLLGKRAAARTCLQLVLERFGPAGAGRLGPATTVRSEREGEGRGRLLRCLGGGGGGGHAAGGALFETRIVSTRSIDHPSTPHHTYLAGGHLRALGRLGVPHG